MHIPDPFARTVRLFVSIRNGQVILRDGQCLPKLKADTSAELLLSPFDIEDEDERARLTSEKEVPFLPSGTTLWARVKDDNVSRELKIHRTQRQVWPAGQELVVEIKLESDLGLILRAGKTAALSGCVCKIPALQCSAASVNEAYSRISVAFEPSRRSHSGNVFRCVYSQHGDKLRLLNALRLVKESEG